MMRRLTATGATLAALTAAPLAMGQAKGDFGRQGEFIISADRLMPLFSYEDVSQADLIPGGLPANETSQTTTNTSSSLSLLYGTPANPVEQFYVYPRIGFDYVLLPNVTVGGNLIAVFSLGGSQTTETDYTNGMTDKVTTPNPSVTGFGVAPRGGYILPLTDMFSLWLRGGFSYFVGSSKTTNPDNSTDTASVNQFALDLEPQFVFTPFPHIGFTAGLDVDIPIAGGHGVEHDANGTKGSVSGHSSIFYLGGVLGMLAHF